MRKGHVTGIYTSWIKADKHVKGFSEHEFKGFKSRRNALKYLNRRDDRDAADARGSIALQTPSLPRRTQTLAPLLVVDGYVGGSDNDIFNSSTTRRGGDEDRASSMNDDGRGADLRGAQHHGHQPPPSHHLCLIVPFGDEDRASSMNGSGGGADLRGSGGEAPPLPTTTIASSLFNSSLW
ncbi:hypothetical protein PIB30_040702 [Stylosanthes scabra]|uniref:Ribonuclease H1 N-terminal domain-containing protein n=1 Tax=Stylosanthes scabra TaxID=79078 RepID=A0ABU6SFJ6_9FABA|nr:hypothetical protein [Stylosanthes scabra]